MTEVTEKIAREYCEMLGIDPDAPSLKGVHVPGFESAEDAIWNDVKNRLEIFFKVIDFYMEKRNELD